MTTSNAKYTVEDVLEKGNQLLASEQIPLAIQFFKRGLEIDPGNVVLLKTCGEAFMEMGSVQEAKDMFSRAMKTCPTDAMVYMYLGQLSAGKDAVKYFEKGIELLGDELTKRKNSAQEEEEETKQAICCACCSLAELYLSELCFEPDAETRCDSYLKRAQECSPDNPQVLQNLASLRISQCRTQDAKEYILKATGIIEQLMEVITDGMGEEPGQDQDMPMLDVNSALEVLPPFEFRCATCRILLEVGEVSRAVSLLESLVAENDQIVTPWLLLGECHALGKTKESRDLALECFTKAKELCDGLVRFDNSLVKDADFMALTRNVEEGLANLSSSS